MPTLPQTGRTLIGTLVALALLCATLEGGARWLLDPAAHYIAIGSSYETVDAKVGQIERVIAERGSLDCLFIGSSVVFYGIMPTVIEQIYTDQTGQTITCYNLGIPAMTATGAQALAEAVVARYHPRVLIYGFTLRALASGASQGGEVYQRIAGTPWIRYQRDDWNAEGWLIAHSSVLRFYLGQRHWMTSDYNARGEPFRRAEHSRGYAPYIGGGPMDPATVTIPGYFADYTTDPTALAALDGLIALNSAETQVLLLEFPLPHFFLEQFEMGLEGYMAEIDALAARAAARHVDLWTLTPEDMIPLTGWAADAHHVNDEGAALLSQWLGAAMADAALAGTLALPVSPSP